MIFRQALPQEINHIFNEGFKEWSKNRTFEQYCSDNAKEDVYGTRYVLDVDNEIVSSLILLKLKDIAGRKAFGIGSVLTPKIHAGNGYATQLLKSCIQKEKEDCFFFLFSDINPEFYIKFNFKILPLKFQRYEKSVCMVYCNDVNWNELLNCSVDSIPNYF
ncbi:GNAT family N-acetyltransferase [Desulfosporosinus hippei]|uniref:Acetyltransferase (GNAT) domain-containing protein n=1 Tax=Desulfosporosinus hippei DSM 8344 TaxID=1121419 RepID=A0A1G8CV76_9FIRM|nr:GNAT family N-acetyltransferase [Desulfosporosinus hippei]SDH49385.1 Acetyltransferase (GNAT) domain-containing protein [Desulfosporosinus hippei DSM 8344]